MNTNRNAGYAIFAGTVAGLATMIFHPTGHDVIRNASAGAANTLNSSVHLLAIFAQPLILSGSLGLTVRIRERRDLASGAFVFFALASVAVIVAAIASGLIAPSSVRGMDAADEPRRAAMLGDLRYTGMLNQAFAKVYVLFTGAAIFLWSLAILKGREMSRAMAIYGLILGAILAVTIAVDVLPLDIHGFGAVMLGTGVWFVWAGVGLVRAQNTP
jgi:hypothetical protein